MSTPPPNQIGLQAVDLTVIRYRKRSLEMYPVLEQELETLVSGYTSVHLALFGIAFGALIAVGITYVTVVLPEPTGTRFFTATLVCVGFSVYFGFMARRDWRKSRQIMGQLRKETVDAVIHGSEI